jgi:uncharacterized protein YkwD
MREELFHRSILSLSLVIASLSAIAQEAELEEQIFILINKKYELSGFSPLRHSDNATCAAMWHNFDMITNDFSSHDESDGRTQADRMIDFDIGEPNNEIILIHSNWDQDLFNQLEKESTVFLNPDFNIVGISVMTFDNKYYVTIVLGNDLLPQRDDRIYERASDKVSSRD